MLNFKQPYPSQRSPVCARNVVATSQPLATAAGLHALRQGGNAVDAVLAAAITLTVVEPNNNGVGSDAFAILWDGYTLHGLNASGRSPSAWTPEYFKGHSRMPDLGWDTVTVPGAVSAWAALSERFGKLAFDRLFDDAISYAEGGFQVGPLTAGFWQAATSTFANFPEWQNHFTPAPAPGTAFRRPDLAGTLRMIADSNGESFYRGELASRIDTASRTAGGALRKHDLESHVADWVTPSAIDYRSRVLHEIPPNGQGLAAQIALGILRHLEPATVDSAAWVHQQVEAMKLAIHAAFAHFADPRFMRLSVEELLAPDSLELAARQITDRASPLPPVLLPISHDTVYLTAADASGMMISYIQSNYQGFGSGIVIPGTGISMQNRGRGFVLDPGHPNCVGPAKKPFHTIIPGFVTEQGQPRLSFGVMGGHMQHQGHVQIVTRIFDHLQNPQAASDAPRWHVYEDFGVGLEPGFDAAILDDLKARGHQVRYEKRPWLFGGAQLIYRSNDGYIAGSDHRKEGHAAGF